MGFRITTNMMMNTYRFNLMNNTNKLADARDKVLTQRNFNSYAEDPSAATRAFRLRRTYCQTVNQISNTKDCYSKFHNAWTNLGGIVTNLVNPLDKVSAIYGDNGTAGESRRALAQVLRETADSMIHSMNSQLGDQFIFAGNDGMNVPFTWSEDGNTLYFRGVNVNAGKVEKPQAAAAAPMQDLASAKAAVEAAGGTWTDDDAAWYNYYTHGTNEPPASAEPTWMNDFVNNDPNLSAEVKEGWIRYYNHVEDTPPIADEPGWVGNPDYLDSYGTPNVEKIKNDFGDREIDDAWIAYCNDQADLAKLKAMSEEQRYIDLGMGAKENAPNDPILGSYFSDALSGIKFIGYGIDETDEFGDPQNYALMLKELADVFDAWDEDMVPQGYNPALAKNSAEGLSGGELEAKAFRMLNKLKAGQEHLTEEWVNMDARSKFLLTNQERLETQKTNTNEEILDIEQVDLAEAITQFSWDQYCYNAALKIGNQLLSQSLIDYMN